MKITINLCGEVKYLNTFTYTHMQHKLKKLFVRFAKQFFIFKTKKEPIVSLTYTFY